MFGIGNQLLARASRWPSARPSSSTSAAARYAWVTVVPLDLPGDDDALTAGFLSVRDNFWPLAMGADPARRVQGYVDSVLTVVMMACVIVILVASVRRWLAPKKGAA